MYMYIQCIIPVYIHVHVYIYLYLSYPCTCIYIGKSVVVNMCICTHVVVCMDIQGEQAPVAPPTDAELTSATRPGVEGGSEIAVQPPGPTALPPPTQSNAYSLQVHIS